MALKSDINMRENVLDFQGVQENDLHWVKLEEYREIQSIALTPMSWNWLWYMAERLQGEMQHMYAS